MKPRPGKSPAPNWCPQVNPDEPVDRALREGEDRRRRPSAIGATRKEKHDEPVACVQVQSGVEAVSRTDGLQRNLPTGPQDDLLRRDRYRRPL